MPETVSQPILDEALVPELSSESFTLLGKTVQLKPLKVRYQLEFTKLLAPLAADAAYDLQSSGWAEALAGSLKHAEIVPKLTRVLALNDGHDLTEEQILDSDVQLADMLGWLGKFALKNQEIGQPIADFFTDAWPAIKRELSAKVKSLVADARQTLEKVSSSTTA
jgi:hypothetical protein